MGTPSTLLGGRGPDDPWWESADALAFLGDPDLRAEIYRAIHPGGDFTFAPLLRCPLGVAPTLEEDGDHLNPCRGFVLRVDAVRLDASTEGLAAPPVGSHSPLVESITTSLRFTSPGPSRAPGGRRTSD